MTEVRERHDGVPADAQHVLENDARTARCLQRLGEDDVIERIIRIVGEVGIGIALDDRKSPRHAVVDALARELDATPVDAAGLRQQCQQLAIAATDIEHLGSGRDHIGNDQEINAPATGCSHRLRHGQVALETGEHRHPRAAGRPRALAAPSRKPRTIANSSGSSTRKAS